MNGAPLVRVAGWLHRFAAGFVDFLILSPILALGVAVLWMTQGLNVPHTVDDLVAIALDLVLEGNPALMILLAVAICVWLSYEFVFCALAGATLGMQLFHLRIVDEHAALPSVRDAAWRTVYLALATLPLGLGLVWIAFDRSKRGLHDHMSGSYVVLAEERRKHRPARGPLEQPVGFRR